MTNKVIDTEQNCICISRPRRFGKSIAANMLTAYYGKDCDSSEIFDKYKIAESESFVFIIDEWDCILREKKYTPEDHRKYLDFIRNLLKDKAYVSLAYMTGILPIKKCGTHSALNMFDEYSMTDPGDYAEYIGFTEKEVEDLCNQYHVDFEKEREWYDGYTFSGELHIYNPKSVVDSIRRKRIANYWTQTETYEALREYIDTDFDGLKAAIVQMLSGSKCKVNTRTFQNDMTTFKSKDDILTLLIHLGYVVYDGETASVYIPNAEMQEELDNDSGTKI